MAEKTSTLRWLRPAGTVLSVAVFCLALWLLHGAVRRYHFTDILARLREVPDRAVVVALCFSVLSYLALGGFDGLAMRFINRHVPLHRTMLASFVSHAVSHSAGFAALTGGAVRYRFYTAAGLSALEVGAVVMFCGGTFVVGAASLGGLALLLEPGRFAGLSGFSDLTLRGLGAAMLAVVCVYAGLGAVVRRPLNVAGRSFTLPRPAIVLGQLAFAVADLSAAAAALWVLLPDGGPSFPAFLGVFVLSNLAGLLAHVPGGLGVFETAVVLMVPDLHGDAVLGALVLWRACYNLMPLLLAGLVMTAFELLTRRRALERAAREARLWLREAQPPVMALLVFVAGATLVVTGAVPRDPLRLAWLARHLPVAAEQGAQMVASGVGVGLLLSARGLHRRLAVAYETTQVLLLIAAAAVLLRGLDAEIAAAVSVLVVLLVASRGAFYRAGTAMPSLSAPWVGAAAVVLIASAWLTLLVFRHAAERLTPASLVDFDLFEGASRALRGEVTAVLAFCAGLAAISGWARAPAPPAAPSAEDRQRAAALIRGGTRAAAYRLLGDPTVRLLFDEQRQAVLAYRVEGRHWIAEGDPVGAEDAWLDLAWRFRETCERNGGEPSFVGVPHRPLYLDLGLAFAPLGEQLSVDLRLLADSAVPSRVRRSPADVVFAIEGLDAADPLACPRVTLSRDGRVVAEAWIWMADASGELALSDAQGEEALADRLALETMAWGAGHGWRSFYIGVVTAEAGPALAHRLPPHMLVRRPLFAALPPGTAITAVPGG